MVKKLQPKLRFRGFTDAWEQRRLGEIATVVGGGTPDTNNPLYWNGDINWFTPAEIGSNVYASKSERRITEEGLEHSSAKLLPAGRTILFTSRASIGLTAILTVDACTNQGFQSLVVSDRTDVFFLFGLCNQIKTQAIRNAAGSTFIEISGKQLAKMPLQIPSLDEQRRIGKIVRTIDSLIAAEKRKLQLIEMKKRLLLQRILSRKMRFGGFCDSWIQLKLDDAICVCSGKDYKHLSKGNIPVYGTGGYMTRVSKALSNRDAIGIGRKGTIDKPYVLHAPFWTVDTLFYALPRNGYDLNFLFAVFQNINWKSKNESTGLPSLSKKNIENTSIITPSIDEQCRIGELFSLFDSILDETNQKIRLLEKKKKALLRDMFV